mmetsp:Transcript_25338/g.57134  ORF Transcript_25338/g.57134 Transcript_25338/m.57134 type:complete len:92 (-) Transcript_25338:339-614(-)
MPVSPLSPADPFQSTNLLGALEGEQMLDAPIGGRCGYVIGRAEAGCKNLVLAPRRYTHWSDPGGEGVSYVPLRVVALQGGRRVGVYAPSSS